MQKKINLDTMVKKLAVGYADLIREIEKRKEELERIQKLKEGTYTAELSRSLNKAQRDLVEEIERREGILKRLVANRFWNDILERMTKEWKKP